MNILDGKVCIIVLLCLTAISSVSQSNPSPTPPASVKAHVLVLGTFHMANPGRDVLNMQVDDMLAPRRQAEIEQFVAALEKFQPTKIAVEARPGNQDFPQKYHDYLAGKYSLKADEIDQIGFRVAKQLGHKQLYPIDIEGDFPFEAVQTFVQKHHQEQVLGDDIAKWQKELEVWSRILREGSVGQTLLAINRDEEVQDGQAVYMDFARFAGDGEYPGPDLLAAGYGRNARIFGNLRSVIDSPNDRVLVIYGSGHEFWLQQNVLQSRDLVLERLADYVH
jgi:hypothetical protein